MAIPMRRAKRRAQRARRRSHQHAPRAGVVVRLRFNSAHFRRQLRRSLRDAGHALRKLRRSLRDALRKLGDSGVTSAAAVTNLHRAIERSAERERVACRIASTSLLTVAQAHELVSECDKHGIAPELIAEPSAYGADPAVALRELVEFGVSTASLQNRTLSGKVVVTPQEHPERTQE